MRCLIDSGMWREVVPGCRACGELLVDVDRERWFIGGCVFVSTEDGDRGDGQVGEGFLANFKAHVGQAFFTIIF